MVDVVVVIHHWSGLDPARVSASLFVDGDVGWKLCELTGFGDQLLEFSGKPARRARRHNELADGVDGQRLRNDDGGYRAVGNGESKRSRDELRLPLRNEFWLWRSGPGEADLERCFRAYLRRFDIEHAFRFVKGTLGWTTPQLCTPAQADRWTWFVAAAYTELRLARGLVADLRLPWERPCDPAKLTPCRVRRGFRQLRAILGTPALPPKSRTPGPGRPKGTRKPPRTRYPAVKKAA